MKSTLLFALLLIIGGCAVNAQATFQKTYGGAGIDYAFCLQATNDGGFIMAGVTTSIGAGSGDIYLVKTNAAGDTTWTKSYGGAGDESVFSIRQTTDHGYIVMGTTTSFGGGLHDVYLVKTDSNGNNIWTTTIGGPNEDYGYGVRQTFDGGYIATGIKKTNSMANDVYLIKTDAAGDTLWTKTYGGTNHDEGYDVLQTPDSGYIVVGQTWFGPGMADVYLVKTNAVGDTTWTRTYGGLAVDYGYSIQQTTDGGYIVAAHSQMGMGVWDMLLLKTGANGAIKWSKTYGGTGDDNIYSVQQTTDKGYVLGGSTHSFGAGNYDMYLVKTDSTGDTLWTKAYGTTSEDKGYYAVQTTDGGFAIAGYTVSAGAAGVEVYLVKTDVNGNTDCNVSGTATVVTTPPTRDSSTAIIVANPSAFVSHPTNIIQSGGKVTVFCAGTGTADINPQDNAVYIYPNPADREFQIANSKLQIGDEVGIIDLTGRVIYSARVNTPAFKIETSTLANGIYIVQLTMDKKTVVKKLVVSH